MPIQGVLKHFAENFKLQFQPALVKSETYFFDFALLRCSLIYEKLGQTERKAKSKKDFFDFALLRCSLIYEKLVQTERKAK